MSDVSPECAPKWTSADRSEFTGSHPSMIGAMRFTIAVYGLTVVVADRAPKKIMRHILQPVGSSLFRSSSTQRAVLAGSSA
jgi:hypothetical protein